MPRLCSIALVVGLVAALDASPPIAPQQGGGGGAGNGVSVKIAVLGDNGTGDEPQYEVGERMWLVRDSFAYELVLMLGDNMYGRQSTPADFVQKFERPYARLLGARLRFHAVLGNHDRPSNVSYPGFNMGGQRFYTFARRHVRFVLLDSNQLDPAQLAWADDVLANATEPWKVAVFHHPLYSDGDRHGSNVELRVVLEPLLVKHGVQVAFSGHEHIYQRIKPQKRVTYFVSGAGGKLRKGGCTPSALNAAYYDQDRSFMLVEFLGEEMRFQTISRTGAIVDAGTVARRPPT
jgi:hypothetical protein